MADDVLAPSRRQLLRAAGAAAALAAAHRVGPPSALAQPAPADTRDEYFKAGKIAKLVLTLKPADLDALKKDGKKYVRATLRENDRTVYEEVGVRLKGSSANAKRGLDQKPSLTLNLDKFTDVQRFHGMARLSLDGSLKDPSYLREMAAVEACRAAGVPAAQVAHVQLVVNGQPRGLYVLREGFDGGFLTSRFGTSHGNFYEGGGAKDVDQPLELDRGKEDVKEQADLKALAAACREGDHGARFGKLEKALDLDKFLGFLAAEVVTGDKGGYALKRDNYRVYHDPKADKIHFVPSDLDGAWAALPQPGKATAAPATAAPATAAPAAGAPAGVGAGPLLPEMTGLVARALLETGEGRKRYLARAKAMLSQPPVAADAMAKRLDEWQARLLPAVQAANPAEGKEFAGHVQALKEAVRQRLTLLNEQAKTVAG